MTLNALMNTGAQGMLQSQRQMTQAASDIAQVGATVTPSTVTAPNPPQGAASVYGAGEPKQSLVEPLIDIKVEQTVFDASAKVVSVADQAIGSLLDTKA